MSSTANRVSMLAPIYTERRARKDTTLPRSSDGTIFPFLKLPRELRDPIYRHLIRDGHVAILRVSKLVKKEASEFLSTHATLRIKLGFPHRIICSELLSAFVTPTAQHVNLCLMVHHSINLEIISGLFDKHIIRESCVVTFNFGMSHALCKFNFMRKFYRKLARLSGFKKLVFRIVLEPLPVEAADSEKGSGSGSHKEEQPQTASQPDTELPGIYKENYEFIQELLGVKLGPARLDNTVEGHGLEYHPTEPLSEDWSRESLDCFPELESGESEGGSEGESEEAF